MKQNLFFYTALTVLALSSCGTSAYLADDEDGIYFRPGAAEKAVVVQEQRVVSDLAARTSQRCHIGDTIILSKSNNSTVLVPNSQKSTYNVNINVNGCYDPWYHPYWGWGPGFYVGWNYGWGWGWGPGYWDPWYRPYGPWGPYVPVVPVVPVYYSSRGVVRTQRGGGGVSTSESYASGYASPTTRGGYVGVSGSSASGSRSAQISRTQSSAYRPATGAADYRGSTAQSARTSSYGNPGYGNPATSVTRSTYNSGDYTGGYTGGYTRGGGYSGGYSGGGYSGGGYSGGGGFSGGGVSRGGGGSTR